MNAYHRRYCRSAKWGHMLQSRVLPWALRDFDLDGEVLAKAGFHDVAIRAGKGAFRFRAVN